MLLSVLSDSESAIPFKYSTSKTYKIFRRIEDVPMSLDVFSSQGRVVILSTLKIDQFKNLKRQSPADLKTHSDQLMFITIRGKLR